MTKKKMETSPVIRTITEPFKDTFVWTAFRTNNTTHKLLKHKTYTPKYEDTEI